jgi:hypothetical protein
LYISRELLRKKVLFTILIERKRWWREKKENAGSKRNKSFLKGMIVLLFFELLKIVKF